MASERAACAPPHDVRAREAILAEGLAGFVDELRLIDLAGLAGFCAREQFANLDDLVQSSLEPFFAPGRFAFGWGAGLALDWRASPALTLDMEFCGDGVWVFFALEIAADAHAVAVRLATFAGAPRGPEADTRRLADAIRAARVP